MPDYIVQIELNITADSPEEAAAYALDNISDNSLWPKEFDVKEAGAEKPEHVAIEDREEYFKLMCLDEDEDEDDEEDDPCECNECDDSVYPEDPYYATPCGTFCSECMRQHAKECGICASEFDLRPHPDGEDDEEEDEDPCPRCEGKGGTHLPGCSI